MEISQQQKIKNQFLVALAVLVVFGLIMVYSSSYIYSKEVLGSSLYLTLKQLAFCIFGLTLCYFSSQVKSTYWVRYSEGLHFITLILLSMTLFGSTGFSAKGSARWLSFMGMSFQPGELCKLTTVLLSVKYFSFFKDYTPKQRYLKAVLLLAPLALLVIQPDFGTFVICLIGIMISCYLSEFPRKYFYWSLFGFSLLAALILFAESYRVQRILSFLNPWADPQRSGFQIIQSFLAFAHGNIVGQGLGNSAEKLFYLPEAHNDFIFSVVGEELGFLGVTLSVLLFAFLIHRGLTLAKLQSNRVSKILMSALIFNLGIQIVFNMGVVLGLLPTKGLNLPFISYGGSALVINFLLIGILLSNSESTEPGERPVESVLGERYPYKYG